MLERPYRRIAISTSDHWINPRANRSNAMEEVPIKIELASVPSTIASLTWRRPARTGANAGPHLHRQSPGEILARKPSQDPPGRALGLAICLRETSLTLRARDAVASLARRGAKMRGWRRRWSAVRSVQAEDAPFQGIGHRAPCPVTTPRSRSIGCSATLIGTGARSPVGLKTARPGTRRSPT
jgi:hypothetical protein